VKEGIVLDIYDFALKMELDGEKYYREWAQKTKYDDLKNVLEGLADDEQRHYKIIEAVQHQTFKYLEADPSFSMVRNVFHSYKDDLATLKNKVSIEKLRDEQIDVYKVALVKEQESVELYKTMQEKTNNADEKVLLERLMKEEEGHVALIDTIIDMLNHVNDWVEAAEFNHRDTY
jgi:rubrerythrin